MTGTDGRSEWELPLKEPVAAVAKVSFVRRKTGLDADVLRGTAVLTESRFLVFKEGVFPTIPRTEKKLRQRLRLEVPAPTSPMWNGKTEEKTRSFSDISTGKNGKSASDQEGKEKRSLN
jgi:hypothetical protein